jgi:hypothetical protein
VSDPEPDAIFRERLIGLVEPELRPFVRIATGSELDAIGRKLDRFRYGAPLKMTAAVSNIGTLWDDEYERSRA